jgi:hypothetical protein
MAILRAIMVAVVIAGCLSGAAYAQRGGVPKSQWKEDPDKDKTAAAIDQQYKATLERTHKDAVQVAPKDPWANLRSDDSNAKR